VQEQYLPPQNLSLFQSTLKLADIRRIFFDYFIECRTITLVELSNQGSSSMMLFAADSAGNFASAWVMVYILDCREEKNYKKSEKIK